MVDYWEVLDGRWEIVFTLTEAAALLNLSPTTLRVQVRNGKLKAVKRGRDWHVSRREVDRYAAENRRPVARDWDVCPVCVDHYPPTWEQHAQSLKHLAAVSKLA
jgi:excisionase family DNA binding protein